MYIEDQYIQEQFQKNFINNMTGNLVLYGTGIHTERLLENVQSDRIVGLMDASKTGQIVFGKKVLSYEEVAKIPQVNIIIIARNSVINVIYRRIQEFVTIHDIPVYNVNGKELTSESVNAKKKECFALEEANLQSLIDASEVVSFDIFDTLVCRCVMRPLDVFQYIDGILASSDFVFSKQRIKAEGELEEGSNYNIFDIYARLQDNLQLPHKEIEKLMKIEIETEKRFLKRRTRMCEILEETKKKGKKVLLISDMYFPQEILSDILSHIGIERYDKLYVSTDYKSSKAERLFEIVKEKENIEFTKWLHIGDNLFSDIYAPQKLGITTYQVYSTIEMLEQSMYAKIIEQNNSFEENVVMSYFASQIYNNPFGGFSLCGKFQICRPEQLAQFIVAPILVKYICWLIKKLYKSGSEVVLFPSRDGYILKSIYDRVAAEFPHLELPESIYFYTSRRSVLIAAAQNERDVRHIINLPDAADIAERIEKRFAVRVEKYNSVEDVPSEVLHQLLVVSEIERECYIDYMKQENILDRDGVSLVDFVAVGTIQEALQRITNHSYDGYYFMRRRPDSKFTENLNCDSLYPMSGDFETEMNLYKFYYFLENIVSSYEPTFRRVREDGSKEFYKEVRTQEAIEQLGIIHRSIREYSEELFKLIPDILKMNADVKLYDALLGFFDSEYSDIDEKILRKIINYDEFLGKKIVELNR